MTAEDGNRIDVELLRPLDWIAAHEAEVGATIQLDLPEMGAEGPATVMAIEPCPTIQVGTGNVITGRFVHEAANVIDLALEGDPNPIGVTANHPFWSVTRQAWVSAGDLVPSEEVISITGDRQRVASVLPHPGPSETVYNIEVNRDHVYHVGHLGTLVHNQCLYRVIRNDETPALGLVAKDPSARYSPAAHVSSGSTLRTQFISTTKSLEVARKYALRDGLRIARIDPSKLGRALITDLTNATIRSKLLRFPMTSNFAKKSEEVLIEGFIPPAAIEEIIFPK
jgi:hypothetical protein